MEIERLHPDLRKSEFTLDHLVFPPEGITDFELGDVDLTTQLTRRITLRMPIVSSPMHTVTRAEMAIALALEGGIGCLHFNMSVDEQAREIEKVRRHAAGFVTNPFVIGGDATIEDVYRNARKNGFFTYPVTDTGDLKGKLIGIVTKRDVRYRDDRSTSVLEVMTSSEDMVVARREDTLDKRDIKAANKILRENNLETLPIIDKDGKIVALVTDRDLKRNDQYPRATKDENKQLKVLVAVEGRLKKAQDRILMAASMGAAGIIIDSRNLFGEHFDILGFAKEETPELDVIMGNIVTGKAFKAAIERGRGRMDAFRIGMGTGDLCITTEETGAGRAMGSAIHEIEQASKEARKRYGHIGLIADGGIKIPKHIIGALLLGADAVMMGSELAALDESPGKAKFDPNRRARVKVAMGMGSESAIKERAGGSRYRVDTDEDEDTQRIFFIEGIERTIPLKGSVHEVIPYLIAGVNTGMLAMGMQNIHQLKEYGYASVYVPAPSKGIY